MPSIADTLKGHDLGFLKIVAYAWGIELTAPDAATARAILEKKLADPVLLKDVIGLLPDDARDALNDLRENEGRMPWSLFTRRFGEVRAMGPARRDRERPDLKPVSPAEILWYRALIGRTFFNLPPEPQEYAYIPDEFLRYIEPLSVSGLSPLGRPASPTEVAHILLASDRIVDHACSLLALLRSSLPVPPFELKKWKIPLEVLHQFLVSAHLLDMHDMPVPEPTRAFLEASRGQALAQLARGWLSSQTFNELRLLPGLRCEGDWVNDPVQTRHTVLDLLSHIPQGQWWSLAAFIQSVHDRNPDFQRPAGDYDSWFICQVSSGNFLRGFGSWFEVDGALLRFLITGPMHWLGMVDLARDEPGGEVTAFRLTEWSPALWHGETPEKFPAEDAVPVITRAGKIRFPLFVSRSLRYQVARFCTWEPSEEDEYHYRITPDGLERARLQGLKTSQLIILLRKHCPDGIPPSIVQALEHWDQAGVQAKLEKVSLLTLQNSGIMDTLRRSRAGKYVISLLNPTTAIIRAGKEELVREVLIEQGYLSERKDGME